MFYADQLISEVKLPKTAHSRVTLCARVCFLSLLPLISRRAPFSPSFSFSIQVYKPIMIIHIFVKLTNMIHMIPYFQCLIRRIDNDLSLEDDVPLVDKLILADRFGLITTEVRLQLFICYLKTVYIANKE